MATGRSTGGIGVWAQHLRACFEEEAWTASFQKGGTGKSPVNSFGQSCPHQKSRALSKNASNALKKGGSANSPKLLADANLNKRLHRELPGILSNLDFPVGPSFSTSYSTRLPSTPSRLRRALGQGLPLVMDGGCFLLQLDVWKGSHWTMAHSCPLLICQ